MRRERGRKSGRKALVNPATPLEPASPLDRTSALAGWRPAYSSCHLQPGLLLLLLITLDVWGRTLKGGLPRVPYGFWGVGTR